MTSDQYVELQGRTFEWLMGLVFLLIWLVNEALLHSFPVNFESMKQNFRYLFFYHEMYLFNQYDHIQQEMKYFSFILVYVLHIITCACCSFRESRSFSFPMFLISCFVMVAFIQSSVSMCLACLSRLQLLSSLSPYDVCHLIVMWLVVHIMGSVYSLVWQFYCDWCLLYAAHEEIIEVKYVAYSI
jgi:hypothetical protein